VENFPSRIREGKRFEGMTALERGAAKGIGAHEEGKSPWPDDMFRVYTHGQAEKGGTILAADQFRGNTYCVRVLLSPASKCIDIASLEQVREGGRIPVGLPLLDAVENRLV